MVDYIHNQFIIAFLVTKVNFFILENIVFVQYVDILHVVLVHIKG